MADLDIAKRIFVKGFPRESSESELRSFFEEYGAVKESKIVRDRNGVSKGYAFITFETEEVADEIRDKEVVEFREKRLSIGKAVRRKNGRPFGRCNAHFHHHRHEMSADGSPTHGGYYQTSYPAADGSVYFGSVQQQQQQHYVLVPAYSPASPQMHYQSQNPYSQHSHSPSQPIYTTTAVLGNTYLPSPYPYSWNEMAAVPVNATVGVVPKVHSYGAESSTEIAFASGQPAQIVSLAAVTDGSHLTGDEVSEFVHFALLVKRHFQFCEWFCVSVPLFFESACSLTRTPVVLPENVKFCFLHNAHSLGRCRHIKVAYEGSCGGKIIF